MAFWSDHQKLVARAIAPKITGGLSMMGSTFIMVDILRSREKLGRTYSRILLVMSFYDFFTSLAQAMSTWPMPADTEGVLYAKGTEFTCNFQGFFTQLGVGAPMYNCSLSFYYLVVIAFACSEAKVQRIEFFMHIIPLTISFGTAIAGIPLTLYNAAGLWCWIGSDPPSCAAGPESDGICNRGEHAWIYRWAVYYGPVWFCVLTITVNMTVVSYLVWAKEKKSLRFRFPSMKKRNNIVSIQSANSDATALNEMDENAKAKHKAGKIANVMNKFRAKQQGKQERQALSSQVFWQAFYYVLAFYITWIFPTLLRLMQTLDKPVPYPILLLMAILLPFQGFFNFLVYVRPRIVKYRRQHPEYSFIAAMFRAAQRTMVRLYTSENRTSYETELQDIEVLDPCHALAAEKHNVKVQKRASTSNMDKKKKSFFRGKGGNNTNNEDAPDDDDNEQAPNSDVDMSKRQRDEMKLLEEDDPSFYEGNSSRSYDMSQVDENNAVDESHNDEDVYMDDRSDIDRAVPEKVAAKPKLKLIDSTTDEEEEESGNTNKESEASRSSVLEDRYPKFLGDPDFYFL